MSFNTYELKDSAKSFIAELNNKNEDLNCLIELKDYIYRYEIGIWQLKDSQLIFNTIYGYTSPLKDNVNFGIMEEIFNLLKPEIVNKLKELVQIEINNKHEELKLYVKEYLDKYEKIIVSQGENTYYEKTQ